MYLLLYAPPGYTTPLHRYREDRLECLRPFLTPRLLRAACGVRRAVLPSQRRLQSQRPPGRYCRCSSASARASTARSPMSWAGVLTRACIAGCTGARWTLPTSVPPAGSPASVGSHTTKLAEPTAGVGPGWSTGEEVKDAESRAGSLGLRRSSTPDVGFGSRASSSGQKHIEHARRREGVPVARRRVRQEHEHQNGAAVEGASETGTQREGWNQEPAPAMSPGRL